MLAAGWSQTQPQLARPLPRLLFAAGTLALTSGIYLPSHPLRGAAHWNLGPVSALDELQSLELGTGLMTGCVYVTGLRKGVAGYGGHSGLHRHMG